MKAAIADIDTQGQAWVVLKATKVREEFNDSTRDSDIGAGGGYDCVVPPDLEGLEVPCPQCGHLDVPGQLPRGFFDPESNVQHECDACSGRGTVTRLGVVVEQWRALPQFRFADDWHLPGSDPVRNQLYEAIGRTESDYADVHERRLALVAVAHEVERLPVVDDYDALCSAYSGPAAVVVNDKPRVAILYPKWDSALDDDQPRLVTDQPWAQSLAVGDVVLKLGALEWLEEPTTELPCPVDTGYADTDDGHVTDDGWCQRCGGSSVVPLSSLMTEGKLFDLEVPA